MNLIDKAEAQALIERKVGKYHPALADELRRAIAALPARGVGVKPLIFSEFKEGGCMGRPHPFQYFITQAHNGRFLCHHDETWHETLEAAQAHAQVAYQSAALALTDAAQAREAAAAVCARYMGDNNREDMEVLRCEAAIISLIGEPRT